MELVFSLKVAMTYSPTKAAQRAGYAVPAANSHAKHSQRLCRVGCEKTALQGEEGFDTYICKKTSPFGTRLFIKKCLYTATLPRIFAVPAAQAERGGLTAKKKRAPIAWNSLAKKSAFRPLLSHESSQYHRPKLNEGGLTAKKESLRCYSKTLSLKKVPLGHYSPTNLRSTIGQS